MDAMNHKMMKMRRHQPSQTQTQEEAANDAATDNDNDNEDATAPKSNNKEKVPKKEYIMKIIDGTYHTLKLVGQCHFEDTNDDGSIRYYTHGTPFFNYRLVPQTWEDPKVKSTTGYGGDNDPLDVIELGSGPLLMGSITPCRVLGGLELIDEGKTDQKILCIALLDKDANAIHTLDDLERVKPGHLDRLRDWLKRYKMSDGKPENRLASETPKSQQEALAVIQETHNRWRSLCGHDGTSLVSLSSKAADFWLNSPGCHGE